MEAEDILLICLKAGSRCSVSFFFQFQQKNSVKILKRWSVHAALSNTTFSLDSSTSKVHIPESDEGHLPVVNKSELYIVSAVEPTHNTTNVDNEVNTNLNQPILVVDNSIPVNTVEEVICSHQRSDVRGLMKKALLWVSN